MLGIGAIRYNAGESVKLLGPKAKSKVIDAITKNGVPFDSFGEVEGEKVNALLKKVGKAMGKKIKPVANKGVYEYINAHGAAQIVDEAGKEVLQLCERVKHPLLTLIQHKLGLL